MSILGITIPATLLLAGGLLWLVLRAVRRGEFDDWEGPAARHFLDDDTRPERDADRAASYSSLEPTSGSAPASEVSRSESGR
jgi:cbb3-type cytochrome oxidase maturation protein